MFNKENKKNEKKKESKEDEQAMLKVKRNKNGKGKFIAHLKRNARKSFVSTQTTTMIHMQRPYTVKSNNNG